MLHEHLRRGSPREVRMAAANPFAFKACVHEQDWAWTPDEDLSGQKTF